ncbi:MAG: ATP-grasp domain-containing protein, partial [Ignavibacteria bacterium]
EFFLTETEVYFSELSPRPHDTGMVTLTGATTLSEFELHARAVLGYPIPRLELEHAAASAVVLATEASPHVPSYTGVEEVLSETGIEVRVFGKPATRPYRRMAVVVASAFDENEAIDSLRNRATRAASCITVTT